MYLSLLFSLPNEVIVLSFSYLQIKELRRLNIAIADKKWREIWKTILHKLVSPDYTCAFKYQFKTDICNAFTMKDGRVVVVSQGNTFNENIISVFRGKDIEFRSESRPIEMVLPFPDENWFLCHSKNNNKDVLSVCDIDARVFLSSFYINTFFASVTNLHAMKNGRIIVWMQNKNYLQVWDGKIGSILQNFIAFSYWVLPSGRLALCEKNSDFVSVWNDTADLMITQWEYERLLMVFEELPNGNILTSSNSIDFQIRKIELNSNEIMHNFSINLSCSTLHILNNYYAISFGDNGSLHRIDLQTGQYETIEDSLKHSYPDICCRQLGMIFHSQNNIHSKQLFFCKKSYDYNSIEKIEIWNTKTNQIESVIYLKSSGDYSRLIYVSPSLPSNENNTLLLLAFHSKTISAYQPDLSIMPQQPTIIEVV